jgi:hypothetical protein
MKKLVKKLLKIIATKGSNYDRIIFGKYGSGFCIADMYAFLIAFKTGCPCVDHAIKKLAFAGQRGAKDRLKDLTEARWSIDEAIRIEKIKRRIHY